MKNKRFSFTPLKIIIAASLLLLGVPFASYPEEDADALNRMYQDYRQRLDSIDRETDIEEHGFRVVEDQVFPVTLRSSEEVTFVPAFDEEYRRLALFLVKKDGSVLFKTDQLETNNRIRGELKQPTVRLAAVAFQDLNGDGAVEIVLITTCVNQTGDYAGKPYKIGDVLFQNEEEDGPGYYRDWRLSDKINRFSMNKSIEFIITYVAGGYSTEFLYTATTLDELTEKGFRVSEDQCHWRTFEKLGRLLVVPGNYLMADYHVFMIYLVNEQGYIIWSFQPMGDFDDLYALMGLTCRDIDGDGLKDIAVLARYSQLGSDGEPVIQSDYSIYYQRTAGFTADTDMKSRIPCEEDETMEELVRKARAYWGWGTEDDKDLDR